MEELNDVASKYLQVNGISIKHFAECTGIQYTKCKCWLAGTRKISSKQLEQVHKFLNGDHYITINDVIKEG